MFAHSDTLSCVMITTTTFIPQPAITTTYATMNSSDGIEESKSIPVRLFVYLLSHELHIIIIVNTICICNFQCKCSFGIYV